MFWILVIAIVFVHLDLERRIWIRKEEDIFAKYRDEKTPPLAAAKWAYYAKAVFLLALILFQTAGVAFRESLYFSFAIYALVLQWRLPFRIYGLLNLILAIACLAVWAWGRWAAF
jgi:hypothetical protein